ncbi:MAG: hypothetical protein KAI17_11885 [Thiotrichaceae bacterium]|nr:hypothetical protein [Thiotrichaceae bacterium]
MGNDEAKKRRKNLLKMRDEAPETVAEEKDIPGEEMLSFVKTLKEQKEQRTKQFSIVKELFDNPLTFDMDKQVIPTTSTVEEISARKKELQYRVDILKSILEVADAEMQILVQALQSKALKNPENPTDSEDPKN